MVGMGAWFFYMSGVVMIVFGILLLAPPDAIAACCACLGPKPRKAVLQVHIGEGQRDSKVRVTRVPSFQAAKFPSCRNDGDEEEEALLGERVRCVP